MSAFRAIFRDFKSPSKYFSKRFMGFTNYTKPSTPSYKLLLCNHIKNQRLDLARTLFDKIPSPDAHLYTIMINGYTQNHRLKDALYLFETIPVRDTVSWNSMLKGCLDCGDLATATELFDEMPNRNVISWTTMVNGYLQFGRIDEAEDMFRDMPVKDVAAYNSMIYGFCCHGRIDDGLRLFEKMPCRNVITWTTMIGGLDTNGRSNESMMLFKKMVSSGIVPTSSTFASILTASANVFDISVGLQIHGFLVKMGSGCDEFVCASLITLYSNCKRVEDSFKVFNEKLHMSVAVWTALLTGNSLNDRHENALRIFSNMIAMGIYPNQSTFTSVLNLCCGLETVDRGKEIHTMGVKLGYRNDIFVANSLITMYSQCGNVNDALAAFKEIGEKNIVSWNSMIVGSAQHGCGKWTLMLFNQMIRLGVDPDEITFIGLLSACSHSGMLQKGRHLFEYISRFEPSKLKLQHYTCMVDILGRCGKLNEAEDLIKTMPMKANSMVWLTLLSASRMHSNLKMAERAAKCILDLDPQCSAAYVLLSNLYASARKWTEVANMRVKMKQRGIVKQPGTSWLNLKGIRHEFLSGDRSHRFSEKIYQKLDWLRGKMKELGYASDGSFSLHDVEEEQKEEMLSYHSERLAIGFALISTVEGSTITVIKNLRVCGDCHSAIKLIAKIVGREIVVRDSSRFHLFTNGICSCGDYW